MKAKDTDILMVPGYTNSGPGHWQTALGQDKLSDRRGASEQNEWSQTGPRGGLDAKPSPTQSQRDNPAPWCSLAHSLGPPSRLRGFFAGAQSVRERSLSPGPSLLAPPDVGQSRHPPPAFIS